MSLVLLSFKFLTAIIGLTIPGYAVARVLRLQHAPFAAFPLSALILCHAVTALAIFDSRITFPAVAAILAAVTALCGLYALRGKDPEEHFTASENRRDDSPWFKPALALVALLLLAVTFRASMYPLGGFDTFTRWDALAREMLLHKSLFFYPPVTGTDFTIYTMPDGFPPLVASVYWWIYAATGMSLPQLTVLSIILQFASILGLIWAASEMASCRKAASYALLAAVASPLLSHSVLIGQESGFLTLAVVGQIFFALATLRGSTLTPLYAAALFAALGALAREYGAALALPGLFILLSSPITRRHAWKYALLAAVATSPWYIRNWLTTGTPLSLPGASSSNLILAALMSYYNELFGIVNFGVKDWLTIGYELITGASIALLATLPYLAIKGRQLLPYTASLILVTALWLASIGKTSGGILYSMRVMAPAVAILAIVSGEAINRLAATNGKKLVPYLLIPASLWGILTVLSFPSTPFHLPAALFSTKGEAPEFCDTNKDFATKINNLEIPSTGILTDSPFLAVILKRETRFRPVIIWSNEISFLLDKQVDSKDARQKLLTMNIRLVALNRASLHNEFLARIPFYRDDFNNWQQLPASVGDWDLFELRP